MHCIGTTPPVAGGNTPLLPVDKPEGENGTDNPSFLSREQELELVQRYRRGDGAARGALVTAHMPLVRAIARNYLNKGLSLDDLLQEGYVGLLRAADRFCPDLGTRFSSYATWWVREAMQRALIRARFIRLPDYLAKSLHAYEQVSQRQQDTPAPSRQEALGVKESTLRALDFADVRVCSLDESRDDGEGPALVEQLTSSDAAPDDSYDLSCLSHALHRELTRLNHKQREVMIYRYGLRGDGPMTLEALADRMGVSREAVRQLQVRALARLRQALAEAGWAN